MTIFADRYITHLLLDYIVKLIYGFAMLI